MLALRSHALAVSVSVRPSLPREHRRFFWAEFYHRLTPAANEFLDLAIALPFPPSFPPYASTIILGTVLLRLAFLPTVLWVCDLETLEGYRVYFLAESWQGCQNGASSERRRENASSSSAPRVSGHADGRHPRTEAISRRHTS